VGGRTVCRLLVRDAAGDSESTLLHETAPQWVTDVVIEKNIPKFLKIPFFNISLKCMIRNTKIIYLS